MKKQPLTAPPGSGGSPSEPTISDVPTTQRQVAREVSYEWLDRLLRVSCEIRPGTAIEDSAALLLQVVFETLDDMAIGVCIPGGRTGQIVVRRSARQPAAASPDPTRLFPEFAFERVVPVQHDDGSTLHLAADDEERLSANSAASFLLERTSHVLGAAIRHQRAYDRGRTHSDELQDLKDQVIQSEKLASLGQIAAGIVHELNNPLQAIVGYSDMLRRKAERNRGDPADIERLSRINEAAERVLRFSRDLIAYSRPATEIPAPVAIHDVIDRALVFCEHVLDQTGVMVERDFQPVPVVRGVAGQLTQVFVNLFTNAAHAMQEGGGLLTITTKNEAGAILVTISDDGHGIDGEHLPRIFEPFFTTKRDGTGTGLGLSIVRNIVLRHGGRIRASENAPKGTTFIVELPVPGDETPRVPEVSRGEEEG